MKHFIYILCFGWTFFGFSQNLEQKKEKANDSIKQVENFNQKLKKTTSNNIHLLWDELLKKHVSDNGNVNYEGFKSDHKKLLYYIYVLSLVNKNENFNKLSKNEKLAYWINLYNALTIDLIVRHYPIKSIKDIKNPWKQRLWIDSNLKYNLDEIEHDILRKMNEPRIHFAIVCASISCPKLQNQAYTADLIETQLTKATKEFLADNTKNEIGKNELKLSKIFKWFNKDFETNGTVIDFINQYTTTTISEDAKINYKNYNWNLNE